MISISNSLKRTRWFKVSVAFLTCLLFLIFPSCQKDELEQGTILNMDGLTYSALPNKDKLGMVKDVNGNWYKTVTIGTQVWMAENLKTTRFNDRTKIPLVTNNTAWGNLTTPGYCWYGNNPKYKNTFGALYNWFVVDAASNGDKNLCPTGWHVPTDEECHQLVFFIDNNAVMNVYDGSWLSMWESLIAGNKLKEEGTIHWLSPSEGNDLATNDYGFTALPGGYRSNLGDFDRIGTYFLWWCAPDAGVTEAMMRNLYYDDSNVGRGHYYKQGGMSIRCIKDN